MATFSLWDLGACNCGGQCQPCNLPLVNLLLTWSNIYGDGGTPTLTYQGLISGNYVWNTTCQSQPASHAAGFNGSFIFSITCSSPTSTTNPNTYTIFNSQNYAGLSCTGVQSPEPWTWNQSGVYISGGTTPTFSCSPLNFVFANAKNTWTVTL